MKIKHLTFLLALAPSAPLVVSLSAAPAAENTAVVAPEVLQAAQAALTAGDLKALQSVFEANPKVVIELAAALTAANKGAAATIATVAAKAFPAQAKQIRAAVVASAPDQKDAVDAALEAFVQGDSGSAQGSNGVYSEIFPTTKVDPSIVSPSS